MKKVIKQLLRDSREYISYLKYKEALPEKRYYDDTYIVEFPKSGVTWLTFLLSNMIIKENDLDTHLNFFNSNDFVIDIHTSKKDLYLKVEKTGYRILKSHATYNPYYRKVIYLWRDPKSVMKSYYRMVTGLGDFNGSFLQFVQSDEYGIQSWIDHISDWLRKSGMNQRIYFINYEDLIKNPEEELGRLLGAIGWKVKPESLSYAIENSNKSNMQKLEDERFKNDIRWQMDRAASDYRFVGNEAKIENEAEAVAYIEKISNEFFHELKQISSRK